MGISGRMMNRSNYPLGLLICRIGPIFATVFFCAQIFSIYDLPVIFGIMIGMAMPFILIPISSAMWRRDMLRRNPYYS